MHPSIPILSTSFVDHPCIPSSELEGFSLTLGTHAQEGYGSCLVCVCMSVCLFVTTRAATSIVSMLKMRYVGVCLSLFSVFNSWIFDKFFRSEVIA